MLMHCTVHYLVWFNCGLVSARYSKKIFYWDLCLLFNKSGLFKLDSSLNLFQQMYLFCYVPHAFLTLFRNLILKCILGAFLLKFRESDLSFWHGKSWADYCCRFWKTEHFYCNVSVTFWTNCWIFVSATVKKKKIVLRPLVFWGMCGFGFSYSH